MLSPRIPQSAYPASTKTQGRKASINPGNGFRLTSSSTQQRKTIHATNTLEIVEELPPTNLAIMTKFTACLATVGATRSSVFHQEAYYLDLFFLSFEHNQDTQSDVKKASDMQRDNQIHSHSVHTGEGTHFPYSLSKSYVKLLSLNSNFISFSFCSKEYLSNFIFSCTAFISCRSCSIFKTFSDKALFSEITDVFWNWSERFSFPVKFLFSFFFLTGCMFPGLNGLSLGAFLFPVDFSSPLVS